MNPHEFLEQAIRQNEGPGPAQAIVPVRLLDHGILPAYATPFSAGCDLTATQGIVLLPGETRLMPLGFIMALPSDCEAQVRPRSGLSLKTALRLPNSPGTIDADYRHEVGVILENTFNPATLPGLIAARPALLQELKARYRLAPLTDLCDIAEASDTARQPAPDDAQQLLFEYLRQLVWVDDEGLPYGTIRIRKGDRIAQLVVTSIRRAIFDRESDPNRTGHDRGGGFGSTGGHGV